jgi:hypothetical protein
MVDEGVLALLLVAPLDEFRLSRYAKQHPDASPAPNQTTALLSQGLIERKHSEVLSAS